jgi:hypothetical protein
MRWFWWLLIVLVVLGSVASGFVAYNNVQNRKSATLPPMMLPTLPPATTATPAATTPAPTQQPTLLWGGPFPAAQFEMPRFEVVPGASWPILTGRPRDQVVGWLMNTYPTLVVRTVPQTSYVMYDARDDRITVVYDPYTRNVLSARIG